MGAAALPGASTSRGQQLGSPDKGLGEEKQVGAGRSRDVGGAQSGDLLLRVFNQPEAFAPPGNLLEMQNLRPYPGLSESESAF